MEESYILLGISAAATTEEIEKAYLDKKREFAPDRFEKDSEEWRKASLMLKELDKAYNDAIMATFAPVKAITPSPASSDGLVEEVPVPFSDEQLLDMDIGELRDSYESSQKESLLLTWGIEDRLLRRYVKIYAGFVFLSLIVNLTLGHASFSVQNFWSRHHAGQMGRMADVMRGVGAVGSMQPGMAQQFADMADQMTEAAQQMTVTVDTVPPSTLILILMAFVTTGYYMLCSLPVPIIIRFVMMGQPVGERLMRWVICSFSITAAAVLHSLTGWLIGNWAGSTITLAFVAALLSSVTLRYEGS